MMPVVFQCSRVKNGAPDPQKFRLSGSSGFTVEKCIGCKEEVWLPFLHKEIINQMTEQSSIICTDCIEDYQRRFLDDTRS